MAERKYYWLKLKEDFFDSKRIKKLRKLAGGDTMTIIYLKMQLKSINNGGVLSFTGLEKTFAEELALDLDEEPENVGLTLNYLVSVGLIETSDNINFLLPYAAECIGSETASAERKRAQRARDNVTLVSQDCPRLSQNGHTEIDIDKDIDIDTDINKGKTVKHKHGEYQHVLLSDAELEKLKTKFPSNWEEKIKELDEGIELKGYSYKNHYLAILNWAKRDAEKKPKSQTKLREL